MNRLFKILTLLFVFLFFTNAYAYTKDDIINLGKSVNVCSNDTKETVNELLTSYTKLINERNITDSNLNIIYDNLNIAINTLNNNNVCDEKDIYNLPEDTRNYLKELYSATNEIIKSSPKIIDNTTEEVNIIIDSKDKSIKVYSGDVLKDVITNNRELNYVGTNRLLIIVIDILLLILLFSVIKSIIKKDIVSMSLIYATILILGLMFVFKDEISTILDYIPAINKTATSNIVIKNKEILLYPSYGNRYGSVTINDNSEALFYGDSAYVLSNGIGSSTYNNLPGFGKTIISGHNTGLFRELFNSTNTDVIINTSYGKFKYKIENSKIVDKKDLNSLNEDYDLIMYTCYPKTNLYGDKRLIVYASLIESEWFEQ